MASLFSPRESVEQVEEGDQLAPKFDENGLIPVVTTDYESGEVLMVAYQNAEALERTIRSGEAWYYSRSRQCLWHKGATSGLVQKVRELRIDDDQEHGLDARTVRGLRRQLPCRLPNPVSTGSAGRGLGRGKRWRNLEREKTFRP